MSSSERELMEAHMQSDNIPAAKSVSPIERFRMARQADAPRKRWRGRLTDEQALTVAGERESMQDDLLDVIGQQPDAGVTEVGRSPR